MKKNNKIEEEVGMLAKDMNLAEIKDLAVSLKLLSKEEVATMKKPAILKIVSAWEEKELAKNRDKGLRKLPASAPKVEDTEDTYNGKKVISRKIVQLSNKEYEDVLVVTGETFRNLIK